MFVRASVQCNFLPARWQAVALEWIKPTCPWQSATSHTLFLNISTFRKGPATVIFLPVLLRAAVGDRALLRLDRLPPLPRRHHDRLRPPVGHALLGVSPHQTGTDQAQCFDEDQFYIKISENSVEKSINLEQPLRQH